MVENVDTDGSGSIEFMEFLLLMGRILNDSPNQEDLRNIFTGREIERGNKEYRARETDRYEDKWGYGGK